MLLKNEEIQEFKEIYDDEFNEPISEQEAGIIATRLVALYESLARPLPSEVAQFTDSIEGGRLDLEAGLNQADEPPASEKVVL